MTKFVTILFVHDGKSLAYRLFFVIALEHLPVCKS